LETGENEGAVDDRFPDVDLFKIQEISDHLEQIVSFLTIDHCPVEYIAAQIRHLVVRAAHYQLIVGHLYKMGLDEILRHCVLQYERNYVLWECHAGVARGHVGGRATARNILHARLWWPTIHKDSK